jgi:hypothetical protein
VTEDYVRFSVREGLEEMTVLTMGFQIISSIR